MSRTATAERSTMHIIGLTGPTGAGKGTVSSLLSAQGIPAIDTDAVYHKLLIPPSPCLDGLTARFGRDILMPDGTLNRPALAARVFAPEAEAERDDLNRMTHGYVLEAVRQICAEWKSKGVPAVLVDAPLLFESGFDRECDRTLAVLADPDIRLARIMARDGLSFPAATSRLRAQKPDDFYISQADAVLYNNGTPEDLRPSLASLLTRWGVGNP